MMYISVMFVILLLHISSVTQAQLPDSNLLLFRRNNVDCSEGKQNIKPIDSFCKTKIVLQFLFIVPIGLLSFGFFLWFSVCVGFFCFH